MVLQLPNRRSAPPFPFSSNQAGWVRRRYPSGERHPELFVRHTLKETGSYRFRVRAGASNSRRSCEDDIAGG